MIKHFTYVADRVDVPMILYNVSRTGIVCRGDLQGTVKHPNINGVKEASGDFSLFSRTRALCGDELYIWAATTTTRYHDVHGRCWCHFSGLNIIPKEVAELCGLCLEGDFAAATKLYFKYADLFAKLFIELAPYP